MSAPSRIRRRSLLGFLAALPFVAARSGRAEPASDEAVTAVTFIHGLPGRERDLADHLLSLAAPTRAEPGCLQYDLHVAHDRPAEFMRFERWTSLAALEAHKATPHLRASFEKRTREGWTTEITLWQRVPGDA